MLEMKLAVTTKCRFCFPRKIRLAWTCKSRVKFREDDFPVAPTELQGIVKGDEARHISRNQKQTWVGLFFSYLSICCMRIPSLRCKTWKGVIGWYFQGYILLACGVHFKVLINPLRFNYTPWIIVKVNYMHILKEQKMYHHIWVPPHHHLL